MHTHIPKNTIKFTSAIICLLGVALGWTNVATDKLEDRTDLKFGKLESHLSLMSNKQSKLIIEQSAMNKDIKQLVKFSDAVLKDVYGLNTGRINVDRE